MPNTSDPLLPVEQSVPGTAPAESNAKGPLEQVARLAAHSGAQDERLTHPDKVEMRFRDDFVAPVQQWCAAHAEKVRLCYIAADGRAPAVFVIGIAPGYDFSLSKPLATLEVDLHRRGWRCSVLQLPSDQPSLSSTFIREPEAIQVFPQTAQPSHAKR